MAQTLGRVLYENLLRQGTVSYDGTTVSGFEPANAYDWRDFSIFRADATITTNLDTTFTSDVTMDAAGVFLRLDDDTGATIAVEYETASGSNVFTQVALFTAPSDDSTALLQLKSFTEVTILTGARLRFKISGGPSDIDIRQLCAGSRLDFPIGQHVGLQPPSLSNKLVVDNVIAINGSIIGRNTRRVTRQHEIMLEYLDDSWVRTYWEPFAEHMQRYSCFWQWDPDDHEDDVAFAAASNISPPENSSPTPKMMVSMPLQVLVD